MKNEEYYEFMLERKNEKECCLCPENYGLKMGAGACGQKKCLVTTHCDWAERTAM